MQEEDSAACGGATEQVVRACVGCVRAVAREQGGELGLPHKSESEVERMDFDSPLNSQPLKENLVLSSSAALLIPPPATAPCPLAHGACIAPHCPAQINYTPNPTTYRLFAFA